MRGELIVITAQGAPRVPKDAMFVRTVYACSVDGAANIMPPGGAAPLEVVMVRIEGASFVYHQIRKIVGLCLAVLAGAAPPEVLDAALCGRTILQAPLAPGDTLPRKNGWECVRHAECNVSWNRRRGARSHTDRILGHPCGALYRFGATRVEGGFFSPHSSLRFIAMRFARFDYHHH